MLNPRLLPGVCALVVLAVLPPAWGQNDRPAPKVAAGSAAAGGSNLHPGFRLNSSSEFGTRLGGTDTRKFVFTADGKQLIGHDAGMWHLEIWDAESGQSRGRFGRFNG